jgi:hypothetical protein
MAARAMEWLKLPGWGWARIVITLMNRLFHHINLIILFNSSLCWIDTLPARRYFFAGRDMIKGDSQPASEALVPF